MGLIKKTYLPGSRKPAFEWFGLNGLDNFINNLKHQELINKYTPSKARNAFRSDKSAFKTPKCEKS